jgi:hypothetical protein
MALTLGPGQRRTIAIRIVGRGGPGTRCMSYANVEVSVQVGKAWEGAAPGDVETFDHSVEVEVVGHADGLRWRGAAVHGPTRERFLYLAWTACPEGGEREMFRRAKLKLATIPADVLARALGTGSLQVTLALRMLDGTPVCATPRSVQWTA